MANSNRFYWPISRTTLQIKLRKRPITLWHRCESTNSVFRVPDLRHTGTSDHPEKLPLKLSCRDIGLKYREGINSDETYRKQFHTNSLVPD